MNMVATYRVEPVDDTDPIVGRVRWNPGRSLWLGSLTLVALVGGPLTFQWDALALFLVTSAGTLCFGHSLGLHRLLIHRTYRTHLWLEHLLVYLGTLVGMAGPIGMIRLHDVRDWAQQQSECHPAFAHRYPFWVDLIVQNHCRVELQHPPIFRLEDRIAKDRFVQFLERTWMAQQIPLAVIFFALGDISWVVWGVAVRVVVSVYGHWCVGHFAHRGGHQAWRVKDVAVQGYDIPFLGWITFGECWHGNHHAFSRSAKLGLGSGQHDPGWWCLWIMQELGLIWDVQVPNLATLEEARTPAGRAVIRV